jgi:Tfp pilus assembly protein PilO
MIKVINLVSLLFGAAILSLRNNYLVNISALKVKIPVVSVILTVILVTAIAFAIMFSKRETEEEPSKNRT